MTCSLDRYALQNDLLVVFERFGLSVAVGITKAGIVIRSQDERVDAKNLGDVLSRDKETG